jgi:hypothetical protein
MSNVSGFDGFDKIYQHFEKEDDTKHVRSDDGRTLYAAVGWVPDAVVPGDPVKKRAEGAQVVRQAIEFEYGRDFAAIVFQKIGEKNPNYQGELFRSDLKAIKDEIDRVEPPLTPRFIALTALPYLSAGKQISDDAIEGIGRYVYDETRPENAFAMANRRLEPSLPTDMVKLIQATVMADGAKTNEYRVKVEEALMSIKQLHAARYVRDVPFAVASDDQKKVIHGYYRADIKGPLATLTSFFEYAKNTSIPKNVVDAIREAQNKIVV